MRTPSEVDLNGAAGAPPSDALIALALRAHQSLDLDDTCDAILAGALAILPAARAATIYLPRPDSGLLAVRRELGDWDATAEVEVEAEHSAASAYRGESVVWSSEASGAAAARGYAPLLARSAATGVLAVEFDAKLTAADREQLMAVARAVAPSAAHALAYHRIVESRAQLAGVARRKASQQVRTELRAHGERLLNDLHAVIHESADSERIVQMAAPLLRAALNASRCIALLAADGEYRDYAACDPDYPFASLDVLWEGCDIVRRVETSLRPVMLTDASELREARCRTLEVGTPPTSILAVPAVRQDRLSAIFIYHHCGAPRSWTDVELDLACRAAEQVATALHNARLYQAAIAAEGFQRTLVDIQSAFNAPAGFSTILEAIASHGMTLLGADAGYVWQLDAANDEIVAAAAAGHRAECFEGLRAPVRRARSFALTALREGEPVISHDAANDGRVNQRLRRMLDFGAGVAIPIQGSDAPIGIAVFTYRRPLVSIDAGDLRRAQVVIAEAARAMENARLTLEARRRVDEWQILSEIGRAITEELDEDRIIATLVDGTARILRVDACSLLVRDPKSQGFTLRHQRGLSKEHAAALEFPPGEPMPDCLAVAGASCTTPDLTRQGRYPAVAVADGLRTMISVPLVEHGDETIAILSVYAGRDRSFEVSDIEALSTLASFALAALSNASRYERERRIARAFQGPAAPVEEQPVEGLKIARRTMAALREADIGGDYFDTIRLEDGRLVVAIGDVAGKGLNAAVHSQSLRWMMRALVHESPEPAKLMTRLNRLLCEYTPAEGFVTLFYGLFDARGRRFRYSNAGHLPPLLRRGRSEGVQRLDCPGLVLGVDPTVEYEEQEMQLERGDLLALYTDGVTDARGKSGHLDIEGVAARFEAAVRAEDGASPPADHVVDRLFEAVLKYADHALSDDATLLVLEAVDASAAAQSRDLAPPVEAAV